jgi:hypothetical protein
MSMTKICIGCGKEKSVESFHRSKSFTDGRNSRCAICVNNYNKARNKVKKNETDTSLRGLIIVHPSKDDFHKMYLFLNSIGYDPSKDIHKQFCEKYNLPYKKRDIKGKNKFSWNDCIKTDE